MIALSLDCIFLIVFVFLFFAEILDNTGLSADANEFVPTPDLVPDVFDVQPTIPIVSNVPQGMEQSEDSSSDESCACEGGFVGETDLLSKFLREDLAAGKCTQEEYDGMMNQIIASEKAAEALNQEPVVESSASNEVAAVAAVVATTAVAAAAVGVEKAAPKPKAAEAKKPEVKSRVAPIKKATTTTATKVAAKPSTTAPKAAAPRLATRTVPPKVSSVTEKKPATSTVTRKPLSNGSKWQSCEDECLIHNLMNVNARFYFSRRHINRYKENYCHQQHSHKIIRWNYAHFGNSTETSYGSPS